MGPDALIMADPGLIMMVKDKWPEMPIHLSVQANTVNYATVKFWQRQGVERIILSRELSLDEVDEIRQECPDIELEVFVHGALCIAYSGRCLLSGYFNHRDPNQGTCTNSCRWDYKTVEAEETAEGVYKPTNIVAGEQINVAAPANIQTSTSEMGNGARHPLADKVYMLEEKNRPGEHTTITEDEHGTYIMNSKDLRAIEHVGKLVEIGVDCLKIEGRTKSHYYVARTTQSYRRRLMPPNAAKPLIPHCSAIWKTSPTAVTPMAFLNATTPTITRTTSTAIRKAGSSRLSVKSCPTIKPPVSPKSMSKTSSASATNWNWSRPAATRTSWSKPWKTSMARQLNPHSAVAILSNCVCQNPPPSKACWRDTYSAEPAYAPSTFQQTLEPEQVIQIYYHTAVVIITISTGIVENN